jgi:predicted NAD-dependent protein-ADP-ribosyltransferase YbiA (DUF1768 family)
MWDQPPAERRSNRPLQPTSGWTDMEQASNEQVPLAAERRNVSRPSTSSTMYFDWRSLLVIPIAEIIRDRMIPDDTGAGVLWSDDPGEVRELSALGALAWEGRQGRPEGSRYEWVGFNLLCNGAPTPFVLDGERFSSVDSFYEALKFPEATAERAQCAVAPALEARRVARRQRDATLVYRGEHIPVHSVEHEGLLAAAISAKIAQNPDSQIALSETGTARLIFPLTFSRHPGALARLTPLVLMIERWKRFHAPTRRPESNA